MDEYRRLREKEVAMRGKWDRMREGSRQWLDQKKRIMAVVVEMMNVERD